jgi:hypothetical protein
VGGAYLEIKYPHDLMENPKLELLAEKWVIAD